MESQADSFHLGREAACPPRPGLCASSSAGRIRSDYPVRPPAPYSLGSLLSEGRLMPLQMASDPLGSKCLTCVWGPRYLPSQANFDASSTSLADIKGAAEHYLPTKGERAELAHTGETSQAGAATLRRTRHIGDFTQWINPQNYQVAFERLLRDLKHQ